MAAEKPGNILVRTLFATAIAAADPFSAVTGALEDREIRELVHDFKSILVLGAGKAAGRMARGLESRLENRISGGLVIVKTGCREPLAFVGQVEASHPLPDEAGMIGTKRIVELAESAGEDTLVICLLSGGASSLLVCPAEGLTLEDKQEATSLLMHAGASIEELNTVRKHLSGIKGGRLAAAAYPATMVSLILSDVVGDRMATIASGPTCADDTTFRDALNVISKYSLAESMPKSVMHLLRIAEQETLKSGDIRLSRVRNRIVGSNRLSLEAAQEKARDLGFEAMVITSCLQGEAGMAAKYLADFARCEKGRRCLVSGGETTVTVRGKGKGGRNQELALAFCLEIEGLEGISFLSAGTDGMDGPTDAAGAFVDGETAGKARMAGLDPDRYLAENDSWTFFHEYDRLLGENCHVVTGPTGTNVMDIQIMLLER